jgi:hypothetical protein
MLIVMMIDMIMFAANEYDKNVYGMNRCDLNGVTVMGCDTDLCDIFRFKFR